MNVIKKVWNVVKPYIFRYYVAFFCGGVVWMFLDVYVTKGIDASFVSACADMALVALALIAGVQAKKIWQDKFKDESYTFAKKIYLKIRASDSCFDSLHFNLKKTSEYIYCYTGNVNIAPDYKINGCLISPGHNHVTAMKGHALFISDYAKKLRTSIQPRFKKYYDDLKIDLLHLQLAEGILISGQLIDVYFQKLGDVNANLNVYLEALTDFYSSYGFSLNGDKYDEGGYLEMSYEGDFTTVKNKFDILMKSFKELQSVRNDISIGEVSIIKYFKVKS